MSFASFANQGVVTAKPLDNIVQGVTCQSLGSVSTINHFSLSTGDGFDVTGDTNQTSGGNKPAKLRAEPSLDWSTWDTSF